MTADELRAPGTDEDPQPKGSPTNPYLTPRQAGCLLVIAVLVAYALVRSVR